MTYFERIERSIEVLFEHYYELQNILVIMGAFIFVLFVVIIVNARKVTMLEKRIELLENKSNTHEQ